MSNQLSLHTKDFKWENLVTDNWYDMINYSQTAFVLSNVPPPKLHLTTSELWFGQEQEGILPELLSSSGIV